MTDKKIKDFRLTTELPFGSINVQREVGLLNRL
jgi:hypothetical protein